MRILQLKTSAERGGAETMLIQLTDGLSGRGHDVLTVVGEDGWLVNRLQQAGHSVNTIPMTGPAGLLGIPALSIIARRQRVDVILSHGARVNLLGTFVGVLTGVPSVAVEHSMDDWRIGGGFLAWLDRIVARRNRGRIAVSRAVGDMLVDHDVLPADHVEVVPNGVVFPSEGAAIDRLGVRARFGLKDHETVIVVAARLARPKGHEYLLEALVDLKAYKSDLRCLLLGDGPLREKLERKTTELGLGGLVVFGGAIDDVLDVLPACDLFVLPSLWEGLPVAAAEAMGMGLPIVATRVAGTPEIVQHEVTGLLVEPADPVGLAAAVRRLLDDDDLRDKLSGEGRCFAREAFSFEDILSRYEEVLACWARR